MYLENFIPVKETEHENFLSWGYIKDRIFLYVRKKVFDDVLKKPLFNLELALKVYLSTEPIADTPFFVIREPMLESINIPEQKLWQTAKCNSSRRMQITSLSDIVSFADDAETIFVASTEYLSDGACALAFPEIFWSFCTAHREKSCYILPSSVMEVLLLPGSMIGGAMSAANLADMVNSVNKAEVLPEQQLDPVVYEYDLISNSIRIAASYQEAVLS